jgi:hypothetical protein
MIDRVQERGGIQLKFGGDALLSLFSGRARHPGGRDAPGAAQRRPGHDRARADHTPDVGGSGVRREPRARPTADGHDLERHVPVALRQVLSSGPDPEHRTATVAFVRFSDTDHLVAEAGLPAMRT